jgi:hypothetical protein
MATPAQLQTDTSTAAREALAQKVAAAFARLADHKEDIERLWQEFASLQDGETIMGCATKTEFCERVLGRSIRAIQYLLNGRTQLGRREQCSPHSAWQLDSTDVTTVGGQSQEQSQENSSNALADAPSIASGVASGVASGGFWEALHGRLNPLVPSFSDGAEHKTVEMLERALTEPAHTQAERNFRNYVIELLNNISEQFAQYAQQLQIKNAELVQREYPTTNGEMAYQIDHSAPNHEAAL